MTARWTPLCLKLVRWTGWPLLPLMLGFLFTGYVMSGELGVDRLMNERTALALHRLLHLPLILLVLAHSAPAVYLACQRWKRKPGADPADNMP